jgi:deleted-in-malignant-brain-tumors protein 1
LGYSGTISCRGSAYYDRGKGRIWMDRVTCTGSESRLSSCTFSGWARHSSVCDHSDDAGVAYTFQLLRFRTYNWWKWNL